MNTATLDRDIANLSPAELAELDRLLAAPLDFHEFVSRAMPTFEWYPAQRLICQALEAVARDEIRRLMIFMPPQEGKTELVSKLFPAYFLQCHPDRWVGIGSYSFGLAKTFSRAARTYFREVVTDLSDEASAVELWETPRKGGLWAVGRGGSATGRPAHLLIVDDPLKDRQEADSETIRKSLHDWHGSVLNMRLQPKNAEIIVHCMTGDTPVLMADGVQRPLRDVRPNDRIATFSSGNIETARVKDWKNQGSDCIFAIRTSGGITVRANARHPLLIARGERAEWVRISDLRIGDSVLRVTGANGAECSAHGRDVRFQQNVAATACRTITKCDGLTVFAPHQPIQNPDALPICNIGTASASTRIMQCWTHKKDDALFAESFPELMSERIGAANSASITMPEQERFAHSCATIATLPWDTERPNSLCYEPPTTYAIILDTIIEIVEAGVEDVFDIEVEGTANFIANGLVSHNTRWHEDDLSGHLLEIERTNPKPEGWHILELPGIAEAPEDRPSYPSSCVVVRDWRKPGEPLGGRYGLDRYEQVKTVSGTREFESQVQQRPAPSKGTIFQKSWWKFYDEAPKVFDRTIISVDAAFKDADDSDFVAIHVYGRLGTNVYRLERWTERMSFTVTLDACRLAAQAFPEAVLYIEDKANGTAIIDTLRQELLSVIPVTPEGGKVARAYACQGDVEHGRVWLPESERDGDFIRQATSFPSAPHDDDVDAFTQAMNIFRMELRDALANAPKRTKPKDDIQGPLKLSQSNPAEQKREPLFNKQHLRTRVHPPRLHGTRSISVNVDNL